MKDYQKVLFPFAYNILGSVEDARDAVQDVMSNYLSIKREDIVHEKGYLIKGVINQSIAIKKKRQRITNDDVWLPEPVATEDADTNINLRDIVSYSLLVLLEKLNPKERAVFILKEAFGYSHEEIAEVLGSTIENSRKILNRAKNQLKIDRQIITANPNSQELIEKYINAIRDRNTQVLENLLSKDIAFYADGGGKVKVVKKECHGLQEVMDLILFIYHTFGKSLIPMITVINHQPAILYYYKEKIRSCQVFGFSDDYKINSINVIVDPNKLKDLMKG